MIDNMDKLLFEPDYRKRVLYVSFTEPVLLESPKQLIAWRKKWLEALTSWHSPYKAVIDMQHLTISAEVAQTLTQPLNLMFAHLKALFLKKVCGFGNVDPALFPFLVFKTKEEAYSELGIREGTTSLGSQDLRSSIMFDNHFKQHVMEMTLKDNVEIDSKEKLLIFKEKLVNNLMQWHSAWSLLIDCEKLIISEELFGEFAKIEKFLKGFFLKTIVGYSPKQRGLSYPFPVYLARHKATAMLESEGNFSGNDANCKTRK